MKTLSILAGLSGLAISNDAAAQVRLPATPVVPVVPVIVFRPPVYVPPSSSVLTSPRLPVLNPPLQVVPPPPPPAAEAPHAHPPHHECSEDKKIDTNHDGIPDTCPD